VLHASLAGQQSVLRWGSTVQHPVLLPPLPVQQFVLRWGSCGASLVAVAGDPSRTLGQQQHPFAQVLLQTGPQRRLR
jgi:hypothetical protein